MTVCLNNKCVVATPQHINYWVDFRNKIIKILILLQPDKQLDFQISRMSEIVTKEISVEITDCAMTIHHDDDKMRNCMIFPVS